LFSSDASQKILFLFRFWGVRVYAPFSHPLNLSAAKLFAFQQPSFKRIPSGNILNADYMPIVIAGSGL
jgi:hypothetical protein